MRTLTTILAASLLAGCLATSEQMLDNALSECERIGMPENETCVFTLYTQQQEASRASAERFVNAYNAGLMARSVRSSNRASQRPRGVVCSTVGSDVMCW